MTNLVFYLNGVQYPSEPLTMYCSSPVGTNRGYESLFLSTFIRHDDRAHMITLNMFTKGFYILDFDPSSDREADVEDISLPRQGNVRIEARFKKPLPDPVTCILYAEFLDTSKSTTLETTHYKEFHSDK